MSIQPSVDIKLLSELGAFSLNVPKSAVEGMDLRNCLATARFEYLRDTTLIHSTYRPSLEHINDVLHMHLKLSHFLDRSHEDGTRIDECVSEHADNVLRDAGLNPRTGLPFEGQDLPENLRSDPNSRNIALRPAVSGLEKRFREDLQAEVFRIPENYPIRQVRLDVDPSLYPAIASSGYTPKLKRRDSRKPVPDDQLEKKGQQYLKWLAANSTHPFLQILHPCTWEAFPSKTVYLYADEVDVPRQEVHHQKSVKKLKKAGRAWVRITNVVIETDDGRYTITASSNDEAMRRAVACLIENNLIQRNIVVFIDGENTLKDCINYHLSCWTHSIYLDWYHFKKKVTELLSSAIKAVRMDDPWAEKQVYKTPAKKGRLKPAQKRTSLSIMYTRELCSYAWYGNFTELMEALDSIPEDHIKKYRGKEALDQLRGYIRRKWDMLTCYAMRKKLGLRNSSNPVEKANDLLVSARQKREDMAWCDNGSLAVALFSNLDRNNGLKTWVTTREISFKLQPYGSDDDGGDDLPQCA